MYESDIACSINNIFNSDASCHNYNEDIYFPST